MKDKFMTRIFYTILLLFISKLATAIEVPKITIEGRIDTQAGFVKDKRKNFGNSYQLNDSGNFEPILPITSIKRKSNMYGIVNDVNFDFKIDGKYNADLTYGGFIRLHGDTSIATNHEIYIGDKAMIYLQHDKIGRFEAGNTPSAAGLFEIDTVNLGRGTYGIEGFWSQWVQDRSIRTSKVFNNPQMVFMDMSLAQVLEHAGFGGEKDTRSLEFIVSPNLLSNYSGHYYSDAPKFNFYTKPISQLTVGISFTPDMDSAGTVKNIAPRNAGPQDDRRGNPATFRNIISGGFMYESKIYDKLSIKTGIAAEYGKAKLNYVTNLRSYEAGVALTYENIRLGGTYGSWLDSLSLKDKVDGARHGSQYYTIGINHQIEKFGYSIGFMQSKRAGGIEILGYQIVNDPNLSSAIAHTNISKKSFADPKMNRFQNIAFDVDYKLVNGFLPYAGISFYNFKESYGAKDKGYVMLIGTRITF